METPTPSRQQTEVAPLDHNALYCHPCREDSQPPSSIQLPLSHAQYRLLLLYHAYSCTNSIGGCRVADICGETKDLFEHIRVCTDGACSIAHCSFSKIILSHHQKCNRVCNICQPLRDIVAQARAQVQSSSCSVEKRADFERDLRMQLLDDALRERSLEKSGNKPPLEDAPPVSPMSYLSKEQLENHLRSLRLNSSNLSSGAITDALEMLKVLEGHELAWLFEEPVDPVVYDIPDYFDIVKEPMDLGTIRQKLQGKGNAQYQSLNEFANDVNLTFDNAILYNGEGDSVTNAAREMKNMFNKAFCAVMAKKEEESQCAESSCVLCGLTELPLRAREYYCCGENCQGTRILRRNQYYYEHADCNSMCIWCSACYNKLDGSNSIEIGDVRVQKDELKKKQYFKNPDDESWVRCSKCKHLLHQICGLFNPMENKGRENEFVCPKCLLERIESNNIRPSQSVFGAEALPRTALSNFLENHILSKLGEIQSHTNVVDDEVSC